MQRQQIAQGVDGGVDLRALLALGPVIASAPPLSGVDCSVRLSTITAVGSGARPVPTRSNTRKSRMIVAKTPAAGWRRVCWYTTHHGGRSCGISRHCSPPQTMKRSPLKTSRRSCRRCGASRSISVK
jgi:hypothetical protein